MNAIYARQSIDKRDSLSVEGQIAQCRRLAGEDARVYADRGFSGRNTRRPAFGELMEAVESGEVEKIFVYRLDRFSRSVADFGGIWSQLELHGVEFVSVTESFDTSTPIGRAMLNIVLVFAQLERETTAERVRDNYLHRFSLGEWTGGPAPFGFDLAKVETGGRRVSTLVANEQAAVVRSIFERYAEEGSTLRGVARELSDSGVHAPRRESWDGVTLSRMLRSPLYVRADCEVCIYFLAKGAQVEQDVSAFDGVHACALTGRRGRSQRLSVANHEGFIDARLWLRVQEKLDGNRQIPRSNAGKYSWLTGLIKCAKCGYAVKINKIGEEYRLICSGRSNFACCDASPEIDLRELEAAVGGRIAALLDENRPSLPAASASHAAELLELDRKIERLIAALAESGEVSAGYVSRQIERLDGEKARLAAKRGTVEKLPPVDFAALTFEEKKLVAAQLISRVTIDGDSATVEWRA